MSIGIEIREATPEDETRLLALVQEFVASFTLQPDSFKASFLRLLQNESAVVLIADSGGQSVGYLLGFVHDTFFANGPVAWVEEIMVHSEHRRAGLGGQLMESFESWCSARGAVLSALATRRASDFYEAIGYEESATYYRRVL
ncbi:MAG: GNAT family N-acetyltransferase [Halioglobus sp.]